MYIFYEIPLIQFVNKYRHDGIPLVGKNMIRCRLALNTNSFWDITLLFQHIRDVVQRYPMEFAGSEVK